MNRALKKILIFGAYGSLGRIISKDLSKKFNILRVGREERSQIKIKSYNNIPEIIKKNSMLY